MPGEPEQPPPFDMEALIAQAAELKHRIAPLVPHIDPADLDLIVMSVLRPFGTGRRFLLRELRPGVNVF